MDSSSSHRSPREEHPASPLRGHVAEAPPEDVPVKPPSPTIVVSRTSLEELVMVAKVEENRREPFSGGAGGGDQRSPAIVVNRASREELGMVAKVEESTRGEAFGGGDRRSPAIVVNRASREELGMVTKVEESSRGEVFGGGDRRSRVVTAVVRKTKREEMVRSAGLGIRVCAVVLCLISFSVMAADKTQGWSGDSFDRYKEYRYCMAMTVITFVYSGFQAYTQVHHFITGKHLIPRPIRYYFDFSMDQRPSAVLDPFCLCLEITVAKSATGEKVRKPQTRSTWPPQLFQVLLFRFINQGSKLPKFQANFCERLRIC